MVTLQLVHCVYVESNNVLDLGKMDANMMQDIETCTLALVPSIQDAMQFCHHFAALNEVSLKFENDNVEWTVQANRLLRLEQILINLISNGIKYTKPGTEVAVSVRQCTVKEMVSDALNAGTSDLRVLCPSALESLRKQRQGFTVVSVRDKGRGIPEDELASLFGEFVQLEISKEKDRKYEGGGGKFVGQSSGSGLGLNLALKFVSRMNGHIWVESCNEGGGAIFSFCFPRGDESFCEEESCHSDSMHLRALELSKDDADTFRALVVDDSMTNIKVLERKLVRIGVHEVTTCSDGSKALEYIESIQQLHDLPNLLLSDLNMPNTADEENGKVQSSSLKAIACCADWMSGTEERCFESGFDGVLRDFLAQTAASE